MARKSDRAEVIIAAIDRVAAPIRKVNRALDTMLAPIRKIRRNLSSLSRELKFDKLGRGLKSLGRGMRNVGAAAVAGIGVALFAINKLATTGDDIAKLTKRLKFNSDAFQELEFAAAISGVATNSYRKGIAKLAKGIGELKAGTGEMVTVLDRVAPRLKKQLLATDDVAEAFELMLKFIAQLEDPTKKAAIATLAFGRSGAELINLANEGAAGIKLLREEAQELGIVMGGEQLKASESMVDTITRLKSAVIGVAREVGFSLLPTIEGIAIVFKDWVVLNRKWLATGLQDGIKLVTENGKKFFEWLQVAVPAVLKFVDSIGGLKTIAIALAVVLAVTLLAPLVLIVSTIGLIPALFVAAGVAIVAFGDEIAAMLQGVGDFLSGGLVSFFESLGVENNLVAANAAPNPFAPGGVTPQRAPDPELSGVIRMELEGAEPANVSADLGGVGVDFEQTSNMPVE